VIAGDHLDLDACIAAVVDGYPGVLAQRIEHAGEAVHRHDLLDKVWGYEAMPTTRTVDNFILDLRKKLEDDPSAPKHLITVPWSGYKFEK